MTANALDSAERASLLLANIVETADDAIISKDLTGTITSWNRGAEAIFGYQAREVIGGPISIIIPPERGEEELNILRRISRGERIDHFETERVRKDGSRVEVSVTISPLINKEGNVVGASKIARDITDRKRMERELTEARERLEKYSHELESTVDQRTAELSAANQELEAFTYTAAHDLRVPLRNMRLILASLQEEVAPRLSADNQQMVERLARSAERMSQLLEALLSFSVISKKTLHRTHSALDDLLQRALAELGHESQGRKVEWKIAPLPPMECDPGLMQQAFINLLSNALKYTRSREVAIIEVGQVTKNGGVAVYVGDNGIGFDMAHAQKLFTPFHRLHSDQFEGSGIGLATVDRIIRRHGGTIWAESKPGEGATFFFTVGRAQ